MKRVLAATAFAICCASPAAAGTVEQLTPYLALQHFAWQEHDGGRELLRESGALVAAGVLFGARSSSSWTLRAKAELFGGEVNYSGETQAPESLPVKTDVVYFGIGEEFDLGYRLGETQLSWEPFAGIGHRWWMRDLQDSTAADGTPVSGYSESWQTVYGRVGARGQLRQSDAVKFFGQAGAKYPFYTGNSIDFVGSGESTLHPGGRLSGFAEAALDYRKVRFSLSYEGLRFSRSDNKQIGNRYYFQPRSSSDIFGMSLGWAFR